MYGYHRYLHALTHYCPTRLSSYSVDRQRGNERLKLAALNLGRHHSRFDVERQNLTRTRIRSTTRDTRFVADLFDDARSEEHTSELKSLMRISYAVLRLTTQNKNMQDTTIHNH